METFNYRALLEVLVTPVTMDEIRQETGLSVDSIRSAMTNLRHNYNLQIDTLGHHSCTHYYCPNARWRDKTFKKWKYKILLDLIDTGEWWGSQEICSILDWDPEVLQGVLYHLRKYHGVVIKTDRTDYRHAKYKIVRAKSKD
ncbi:hypothetical protein [Vibrio phage vB_VhaP_PG11]|nr:hypothetical protein [Vibrio phage vB_VhaP_PG11]